MAWTAVEHETLQWDSRGRGLAATRAQSREMFGPYRSAIPAMIAGMEYEAGPTLAAALEDAAVELARYDADMADHPAPLDAILLRTESAASSQIENLTASARSVGLAELGDSSKVNARLIVSNTRAMREAIALAGELTPTDVALMHRVLLAESEPELAGRWRQEPVWIGRSSVSPIGADYVAPRHERIPELMVDLMSYANGASQQVLAQAAIAHAQFETIHPFHDGNGRTGRALLHALLRRHGQTRHVTVPVSAGLLHDIAGYHDSLTAYRAGDPEPIVAMTVEATFRAINNGRQLAREIEEIRAGWREQLTARRDSAVWRLADQFLARPVLDAAQAAELIKVPVTNVHRHLARLTEAGVLVQFALYRRGLGWRADAVLAALDRFAARAGRRTQAS